MQRTIPYIIEGLTLDPKIFDVLGDGDYNTNLVKAFANRLGKDLSTYDNMLAAGRLLLFEISLACGDISDYIELMKHRLHPDTYSFFKKHHATIKKSIAENSRDDYIYHDLFSASTLIKTYLLRPYESEEPWETPQQMHFRVAVQTHMHNGIERVLRCKRNMSKGYYTPASPTIFNSGTLKQQLSSCFLLKAGTTMSSAMQVGAHDAAIIAMNDGGIGIDVSEIPHTSETPGLVPVCRVYDRSIGCVRGGRRDGAATLFCKLHHMDVKPFILATNNYTDQTQRIFVAGTCLWTSRYFFEKVEKGEPWYTFCPSKTAVLNTLSGYDYEVEYERLVVEVLRQQHHLQSLLAQKDEAKNFLLTHLDNHDARIRYQSLIREIVEAKASKIDFRVFDKAGELLDLIVKNQVAASTPYIMHGDACNWKNNQKHLGSIDSSNLCVTGDTQILTVNGYSRIDSLIDQEVQVWNGISWSTVTPKCTSESEPIWLVTLNNGMELKCTGYHKWLMDAGGYEFPINTSRKETRELVPGDRLFEFEYPLIYSSGGLEHRIGDVREAVASGEVNGDGNFSITFMTKSTASVFQLMLTTFSIGSWRDGTTITLVPSAMGLFKCFGIVVHGMNYESKRSHPPISVLKVENLGVSEPVYCFYEPQQHAGIFNGILTGQCLEIIEKATPTTIPSCNLASHNVSRCVKRPVDHTKPFAEELLKAYNWDTACEMFRDVVDDLDERIDLNKYPFDEFDDQGKLVKAGHIRTLNEKMRPLGIGVSGFADALLQLDVEYESEEAVYFNKVYFACKYFNELCQSVARASVHGCYPGIVEGEFKTYTGLVDGVPTFETLSGSPFSHGILQFDLWKEEAQMLADRGKLYKGYKREDDEPVNPSAWGQKPYTFFTKGIAYTIEPTWDGIKEAIKRNGIRNSMLGAIMPTATTANIFRNAESTEPYQANVFSRDINSGTYLITVRHLEKDFKAIGCWSANLPKFIIICQGSVKYVKHYILDHREEFPHAFGCDAQLIHESRLDFLLKKYKTTYEISQKHCILLARQRGIYIDQSQSLNFHIEDPEEMKLKGLHSYTQKMGVKTGMYYLRQNPTTFIGTFDADVGILQYFKELTSTLGIPTEGGSGSVDEPEPPEDEEVPMCKLIDGKRDPNCLSCQ